MRFDVPEKSAILTYLHGDIPSDQMEAAVYWEYCRLNPEVLRVANLHRDAVNSGSHNPMHQIIIEAKSPGLMGWPWAAIWSSLSFPAAPWVSLTAEQKEEILPFFPTRAQIRALRTPDVRLLDALKIFDHWKDCAEKARKASAREPVPAPYWTEAEEHVVFTINYREGLDRTEREFAKWLREAEQAKNFDTYQKRQVGRDRGQKKLIDMLKTLAICRVFNCAEGNAAATVNWLITNQQENRKYPEQRRSGYTERDIRNAVNRSRSYETELFSKAGLEL